jgi:hypothetical protein
VPVAFIPTALRRFTGNVARVDVSPGNLLGVIEELERRFPGIREALIEDDRLRPGVLASIDGDETASLLAPAGEASEVHFVIAISGG